MIALISIALSVPAFAKPTYDDKMTLGNLLFFNGNVQGAIRAFSWAARLKPDALEPHLNLMNLQFQDGNVEAAINECREAIRIKPKRPDFHMTLGGLLRSQNNLVDAMAELNAAMECGADKATCENAIALAHLQNGDRAKALEHAEAAINHRHNCPDAHLLRAILLFQNGDKDEAMREIDVAIDQRNEFADAHTTKGDMLSSLSRWKEASDEYKKAITMNPKGANSYLGMGNVFMHSGGDAGEGSLELAHQYYVRARELNPNDKNIWYAEAIALQLKGDIHGAINQFQEGMLLDKDTNSRAQIQMHIQELLEQKQFQVGAVAPGSSSLGNFDIGSHRMLLDPKSVMFTTDVSGHLLSPSRAESPAETNKVGKKGAAIGRGKP